MCGIAGVLNRSGGPVPISALRRMGDVIAHRGPDGAAEWSEGPIGLVNRRLAVMDPTPRGDMPMTRGELTITYNGELYNFRELKTVLERRGHRFRTRTDTEVILAAYQEWGAACVSRFNGMFAFAIWDARRQELFLARDRYGVKPLYLAAAGPLLLFGSEIKSLLAHGAVRARLSLPHLLEYFTFQNIFSDGTLFDGIRLLPAGHHLTVSRAGGAAPGGALLGLQLRRTRGSGRPAGMRGGAPSAVPAGRLATAGRRRPGRGAPQRGHGLRLDHRDRGRRHALASDLHGRASTPARPPVSRPRTTNVRRPRRCRTCSRPSISRRC